MEVSIHKVAEGKLHKQNKSECGLATATMEAYTDCAKRLESTLICTTIAWKNTKIFTWLLTCGERLRNTVPIRPGEELQFGIKRMRRTSVYAKKEVYFGL